MPKLCVYQIVSLVMFWQDFPDPYMILVFGNYQVGIYVQNNLLVGEHILGDSGYMLKQCLLKPYRQPTTEAHNNYNYSHKKTRVLIEQTFGRWKRRFHCLHGEIPMAPDKVCIIINACAVLA